MGLIRKQTIQLSFLIYIGFIIGAINTYFLARLFTTEQYGLTQVIMSIAQVVAPLGVLGMPSFINRFFPYYFDHLDPSKNDMLFVALLGSFAGGILIFSGCLIFEPLVVRKFSDKSALVVQYYHWALVFAFFYLCFLVLESYMNALRKTVLPGFLKETGYRILLSVLVALYAFHIIRFHVFVILFCCTYLVIVLVLLAYLLISGQLHITTRFSHVTRRLKKRVAVYVGFVYSSIVIHSIAAQIPALALAGTRSLGATGVYMLNQFSAALLQVPYRSLQNISTVLITRHWKNKEHAEIDRIYKRSAINLLLISSFLFINMWINYDDGLHLLGLYDKFAPGKTVFLILGIYNILDMATGVNASMLATSPAWRYEFYSGMLLVLLSVPLNIFMARRYGMEGVALATLITFTTYNAVRLIFIKRRFNMWPFSIKTLYAVAMSIVLYLCVSLPLGSIHGVAGIALRSLLFSGAFIAGTWWLQLTPDLHDLVKSLRRRLSK